MVCMFCSWDRDLTVDNSRISSNKPCLNIGCPIAKMRKRYMIAWFYREYYNKKIFENFA